MTINLGCIADDFTGATDIALLLKQAGYSVLQTIGVVNNPSLHDFDAVVVALKTRTCDPKEAIELSVEACHWLTDLGASQIFFKYCSTFDSTDTGNIGPVADSLLSILDAPIAIACPSFPRNGRTVNQGKLFVNGELLSDSPMHNHPLTPMTDADLVQVLQRQSKNRVGLVSLEQVERGAIVVKELLQNAAEADTRLMIVDAITDDHLKIIGEAVVDHKLVTGGSAVGAALVRERINMGDQHCDLESPYHTTIPIGPGVVLAGSCSQATLRQIEYAQHSMPWFKLDIESIALGSFNLQSVLNWVKANITSRPILIYASEDVEQRNQRNITMSSDAIGHRIETVMAALAAELVEAGIRRLVVAGGETAGAIVTSLGVQFLQIGEEIETGVPWTVFPGPPNVALALKSGNFGSEDFFTKAFSILEHDDGV